MLAIVSYPTLEEARAHSDRAGIREWVHAIDRGLDEFEAQKLRTPEQLPEIGEDNFNLIWDFEADEDYGRTLIKHGDVVIFSEPARWEESRRFKEVAEILKAKYGDRIKDLVPTEGSKLNLYGDDGKSPGFVDNVRAWFFGANTAPREGTWSGKKPATPATPPATPAAKPAAKPAASSERKPVDSAKASDGTTYKVGDVVSLKGKQVRITKIYSDRYFDYEPAK